MLKCRRDGVSVLSDWTWPVSRKFGNLIRVAVAGAGMDGSVRKPFQLFILWQVRSAHRVGREIFTYIASDLHLPTWLFKMYFKANEESWISRWKNFFFYARRKLNCLVFWYLLIIFFSFFFLYKRNYTKGWKKNWKEFASLANISSRNLLFAIFYLSLETDRLSESTIHLFQTSDPREQRSTEARQIFRK